MTPQIVSTWLKWWSLHRCTCQGSSVGNGFVCYGNIMERLQDLNTEVGGQWQGKLTSALSLMGKWPHASRVSSCCIGGLVLPSPNCLCWRKLLLAAWHSTSTTHRLPLTTQSCLCSPHFTVYKNFQQKCYTSSHNPLHIVRYHQWSLPHSAIGAIIALPLFPCPNWFG